MNLKTLSVYSLKKQKYELPNSRAFTPIIPPFIVLNSLRHVDII